MRESVLDTLAVVVTQDVISGPSAKPNFANLKFIVYSMLAGVTLFAMVALYAVETRHFRAREDLGPLLAGVVIVLSALAYLVTRVMSRRLTMQDPADASSAEGVAPGRFVSLTVVQAAAVESVALIATTFYLLTGVLGFLAVPLAGSYLLARLAKVDRRFEQFSGRGGTLIQ